VCGEPRCAEERWGRLTNMLLAFVSVGPRCESNHGQNREPHSTVGAWRIAGNNVAGLGKLPDSYCNSMECFCRVGSHNPLNFLNCHTPSTGTTSMFAFVRNGSSSSGFNEPHQALVALASSWPSTIICWHPSNLLVFLLVSYEPPRGRFQHAQRHPCTHHQALPKANQTL
jgi:hypothetical protein